ncbi:uncharacterized protein LOC125046238 isoform X2 [Penaeus chinensis]|uniref:uncharacterized protein LOC125046238 isoform X2 n=1 Tax=Penaeus chinensis TaxID=139456 RepID=UPI001FB78290|nr:uncharacterized protein LOC125046238 isoform X2 [Penaeus chinensis]XP_047499959.1 uncharacterized protein LOC125046238 isoform X2 [Penaeus chinensis]
MVTNFAGHNYGFQDVLTTVGGIYINKERLHGFYQLGAKSVEKWCTWIVVPTKILYRSLDLYLQKRKIHQDLLVVLKISSHQDWMNSSSLPAFPVKFTRGQDSRRSVWSSRDEDLLYFSWTTDAKWRKKVYILLHLWGKKGGKEKMRFFSQL